MRSGRGGLFIADWCRVAVSIVSMVAFPVVCRVAVHCGCGVAFHCGCIVAVQGGCRVARVCNGVHECVVPPHAPQHIIVWAGVHTCRLLHTWSVVGRAAAVYNNRKTGTASSRVKL